MIVVTFIETLPTRSHPQHRYIRSHRLGQDHADRASALLLGPNRRNARSERQRSGWRDHGLDGTRETAWYHNSIGSHLHRLEKLQY
jgi:hypothetical protein